MGEFSKIVFLNALIILALMGYPFCVQAADVPSMLVSDCSRQSLSAQANSLRNLDDLDSLMSRYLWAIERYRETLYNPFWQAWTDARETHSKIHPARAQVLQDRYLSEAEGFESDAHELMEKIRAVLGGLRGLLLSMESHCPGERTQECFYQWADASNDQVNDLTIFIENHFSEQQALNEQVKKSLTDSLSDHDSYATRTEATVLRWHRDFLPVYRRLYRNLKDRIGYDWPNEVCCNRCESADKSPREKTLNKFRGNALAVRNEQTTT